MQSVISVRRQPGTSGGFTVIELMIGLAVGAILLFGAVPSFVATLHKSRIKDAASQLQVSLNLARGEATKRRNSVRVCPSVGGTSCDTGDIDWANGWLLMEVGSGTVIRRVDSSSVHRSITIDPDETVADFVQFNATGDASSTTGEFRICHDDSNIVSRSIDVSPVGRVEMHERTQTDCGAGDL